MPVQHDAQAQEFTITRGAHGGELAYARPDAHTVDFTHTYVDEALRGQGVAEELARAALAFAREAGLRVRTSCRFMAGFVQRHKAEYGDLVNG